MHTAQLKAIARAYAERKAPTQADVVTQQAVKAAAVVVAKAAKVEAEVAKANQQAKAAASRG